MRSSDWSSDVCSSDLVRDVLDRGYYEHSAEPGGGYRNGLRQGRLKTAEGFIDYAAPQVAGTAEPFRSELRQHLKGHSEALEDLAIEMLARGLSVRDIEDAFKDETGRLLLSRSAVSELGERSEEHTSELQSLMRISYAVFCLKKKKK